MITHFARLILVCSFLVAHGTTRLSAQPTWDWAVQHNTDFYDYMASIAHDANGNIYVCGDFLDSISFGNVVLQGNSSVSLYVAKYDPYGNLVWARTAATNGSSHAREICVAPDGSIYVTGSYSSSSITFWPVTITGTNNIFLVKYDSFGGVVWAKSAGGNDQDDAYSVTTDASGHVIISGMFQSAICNFDAQTISPINLSTPDVFIAKYDSNGNALWARSCGGPSWDNGINVECDNGGNIYLNGLFMGASMNAGSITLTGSGNYDMYILKYDPAGNELWGRSFGGSGIDECYSARVNLAGNVVIAGHIGNDTVAFDSYVLLPSGGQIFLATLDPAGNVIWVINEGSPGNYLSYLYRDPIGVDGTDDIYLAGHFTTVSTEISGDTLYNADNTGTSADFFVAKYDDAGNLIWVYNNGSSENDAIYGLTVKDLDNFAMTGAFAGSSLTFQSDVLINPGIAAYFLVQAGSGLTHASQFGPGVPQLMLYPNPTVSVLELLIDHRFEIEGMTIEISDFSGRCVLTQKVTGHHMQIDCSALAPGAYVLTLNGIAGVQSSKFIVGE